MNARTASWVATLFTVLTAGLSTAPCFAAPQRTRTEPPRKQRPAELVLLEVTRGGSITFRATGSAVEGLTSLRVVPATRTADPTRAADRNTNLTAALDDHRDGGRWIRVTAPRAAAPGTYRVEGLVGRKVQTVLPVAIQVTRKQARRVLDDPPASLLGARLRATQTGARRVTGRVPRPSGANRIASSDRKRTVGSAGQVATAFKLVDVRRSAPYTKILEKDGERVRADPALNFDGIPPGTGRKGGGITIEGITAGAMDPRTWTPAATGWAHGTLAIEGYYLDKDDMRVRIGSTVLAALPGATAERVEYRLPPRGAQGKLRLERLSDNKEVVLTAKYEVRPAFDAFDGDQTTFDLRNAYLLSLLSWTCYQDADDDVTVPETGETRKLTELWSDWGLTLAGAPIQIKVSPLLNLCPSGMTEAYVLHNDDCVFVTFRGSTDHNWAQDWLDNDFDFRPLPMPSWNPNGGALSLQQVIMHKGFYDAAIIAYAEIRARVKSVRSGRRVWVTGHSLGGAVATITAFKLRHDDDIAIQGVHVFGAPPVGNGVWAAEYDSLLPRTWRWNVENDPVPVLYPPPAFFHVGKTNNMHLNGSMKIATDAMFGYVPNPGSIDDLAVKHMSYWHRMFAHDSVQDLSPRPPAPPSW